jgi:hypothetical protein
MSRHGALPEAASEHLALVRKLDDDQNTVRTQPHRPDCLWPDTRLRRAGHRS